MEKHITRLLLFEVFVGLMNGNTITDYWCLALAIIYHQFLRDCLNSGKASEVMIALAQTRS